MREILFRGKRVDNGEWVIGDGIHYQKSINYIGTCWIDGRRERVNDWFHVHNETVGQYTGLKDKHGKHIFEGDVVRYTKRQFDGSDTYSTGAVDFMEGCFAVCDYCLNNWLWNGSDGNTQLSEIEVIGNIHDNPELLGGINDAPD